MKCKLTSAVCPFTYLLCVPSHICCLEKSFRTYRPVTVGPSRGGSMLPAPSRQCWTIHRLWRTSSLFKVQKHVSISKNNWRKYSRFLRSIQNYVCFFVFTIITECTFDTWPAHFLLSLCIFLQTLELWLQQPVQNIENERRLLCAGHVPLDLQVPKVPRTTPVLFKEQEGR